MDASSSVLGVDFGGTICEDHDRSELLGGYSQIRAKMGAFIAIREFVDLLNGRVCIISKCSEKSEALIMHWLRYFGFFRATHMSEKNVFFCRERGDKAGICRKVGVTTFVDNRLEVLSHMAGIVPVRYLICPDEAEVQRFASALGGVRRVQSWHEIMNMEL